MPRRALKRGSSWAWTALAVAIVAGAAVAVVAFGAEQRLWSPEAALGQLPIVATFGAAAMVLGLFARFRRRDGQIIAVAAILLGLAVAGGIGQYLWRIAEAAPLIDISTDLEDPPAFARLPVRADRIAHVPVLDRPGYAALSPDERWRAVHAEAYPDLKGILVSDQAPAVLRRAEALARERGWEVVAVEPAAGRMEMVATSRFFGFRDNLVLRARPSEGGTKIDVRGLAQNGTSDHGRIARVIRHLQRDLRRT